MNYTDTKCVMIIDKELPLGLIANTSAILGCSLGKYIKKIVGEDSKDASNLIHKGIVNIPIPILSSTRDEIKKLYDSNTLPILGKSDSLLIKITFFTVEIYSLSYAFTAIGNA